MHVIAVRNVNHALSEALWYLDVCGAREDSRNGPVIVAPGPVTTVYARPTERVLFNTERNANPFFHLMEALWMLAGRCDLAWPEFFNKGFSAYSDDGATVNGAYGYRWRRWFGLDQIEYIVDLLKADPNTRRAVMGMWSPGGDLNNPSKDLPCNTHIYFDLRGGKLNMSVCCRSNDIIWGAYGANAVHMSVLQEFIAAALVVPVGVYRQVSNNFHLYTDGGAGQNYSLNNMALRRIEDLYIRGEAQPYPLVCTPVNVWERDLQAFMKDPSNYKTHAYEDHFFTDVALPMFAAWADRKSNKNNGMAAAQCIRATDWREACTQWIKTADERRARKDATESK